MSNFSKLSRAEMKNVLGGKVQSCTITYAGGGHGTFTCSGSAATPDNCQAAADSWCQGNNSCSDIDCPGAA